MLNNQSSCVIIKVIAGYDYIDNVIEFDYDYVTPTNYYYDYLISCNRLKSVTMTDGEYPMYSFKMLNTKGNVNI